MVGDIIKYSETKLRAYFGVKSRMSVYSVPVELRRIIDEYFAVSLPSKIQKKQEEKHEYDALYDAPIKKLSLSNAAKIENESWKTTEVLVSTFNDVEVDDSVDNIAIQKVGVSKVCVNSTSNESGYRTFSCFGVYGNLVYEMYQGNTNVIREYSLQNGKMADAIVDEINEIAYELIGDLLIEEDGEGNYNILTEYVDQLKNNGE